MKFNLVLCNIFYFTLIETFLIIHLLIIFEQIIIINGNPTALCFVMTRPELEALEFAEEVAIDSQQYGIDVFIMIDDEEYKIPIFWISSYVQILHIKKETCIVHGYRRTTYVYTWPLEVTAWDKVFLYFSEFNPKHSFIWIIENDVFIPSIQAFRAIHQLYSPTSDLIVQRVIPNIIGNTSVWSHYSVAIGRLFPPWYRSMANVLGLSRRLLVTISDFVRWRGFNVFHEFSVQTLSLNLNMTVVSPIEFDTLFWRKSHTWNDINNKPNNFFHPVKNWTLQKLWHQK